MKFNVLAAAAAIVASVTSAVADGKPTAGQFRDGDIVVFWGDSITQQARWIRFLTDFYHTRYPERNIKYRNAGIAGNSFGGGIKQMPLDVTPWKPSVIVTMFGMNDSAAAPRPEKYHPGWPSNDVERARLRKRVDGGYEIDANHALAEIRTQCGEATRIIMMTPSIYDSTARAPKDEPVNDGWNITLGESGKKLIEGYEKGKWELVDIWTPMTAFNEAQQKINPKFSIVSNQERVHPDDRGGYFMAQQILMAQGVDHTVSKVVFNAGSGVVEESHNADVSGVRKTDDGWEMTVLEKSLPFPTAKTAKEVACRSRWSQGFDREGGINNEWFCTKGLAKGVWELFVDGELVWRGTDGEFAFGVNLGRNPDTPQMAHAKRVAEANRLRVERESYLRALASLRWWFRMKVDKPDDVAVAAKWLEDHPERKDGLFGRGQYLKEYMVDWPRRDEIYAELDAMDVELAKLRQPVAHKWTLRQVESGERDYLPARKVTERMELFNGKDLSGWYKYLSGHGRDNDPQNVFTVKDGVISIHGLETGCITTKDAYRDYRCQVEYRWVGKSYNGRAWKTHDSGFLFHSQGPDGMYHGTWKWSFEANMIQSRTPDLITVVLRGYAVPPEAYTYRATVDVDENDVWTPGGKPLSKVNSGHWHNKFTPVPWHDRKDNPTVPPEKPVGEWNLLEVVARGDKAEFFLNGVKTLEAYGLHPTEGQLQIQSEGSDCEVRRVTLLPLEPAAQESAGGKSVGFDIRKFGADMAATPSANAKAIQSALDECARRGGGLVTVPAGTWRSGTIWLRSGVELHLSEGAVLKASDDLADYNALDAYPENWFSKREQWNGCHFIIGREASRVSITGPGTIDGSGDAFFEERPPSINPEATRWMFGQRQARDKEKLRPGQLVSLIRCRDIFVGDGLMVTNSPCWSLFFYGCSNVVVRGYKVRNGRSDGNTDGMDIDCSCDVTVSDADIVTGDDGIAIRASGRHFVGGAAVAPPCERIRVSRCKITSEVMGFRIGVGEGLIRDVTIEDVEVRHASIGVSFETFYWKSVGSGVDIENVTLRNFTVGDCYANFRLIVGGDELKTGVRNVRFENCLFGALFPAVREGDPDAPPADVRFDGCVLSPVPSSSYAHLMRAK